MNYQLRSFINRVVNFVRPKPRFIPLTSAQILKSNEGLDLVERFNDLFYSSGVAESLNWRGMPMVKNPCDLWMVIELIQRLRPKIIVETGTHYGGSATFYADIAAVLGLHCTVITIDFNPKWSFDPLEKGIISLIGYSIEPSIIKKVSDIITKANTYDPGPVMVMLDSDHSEANVSAELQLYSSFVTRGSYLIVEDTNINGHPSFPSHGPGPWEAVEKFLKDNKNFVIDLDCQRYLLTSNPNGWLRRIL